MKQFLLILAVSLISGCATTVTKSELISELESNISKRNSHINIVWYRGTKNNYHYLSHVYAMFGTANYKILDTELVLPKEVIMPLTSNDQEWQLIYEIEEKWKSSRKLYGKWVDEPEGNVLAK